MCSKFESQIQARSRCFPDLGFSSYSLKEVVALGKGYWSGGGYDNKGLMSESMSEYKCT
jgi:hypothetical protein